jgi:hypothetical protein
MRLFDITNNLSDEYTSISKRVKLYMDFVGVERNESNTVDLTPSLRWLSDQPTNEVGLISVPYCTTAFEAEYWSEMLGGFLLLV